MQPRPRRMAARRRRLLAWFDAGRRALPWRDGRDPYRVWVAETMLQQTRVAVAAPAYERFLAAFPRLEDLARASEEAVLAQWSGLGYYGRARALRRAAREILAAGGSAFPRDLDAALALPGVGPYTAAAVLSIAYGAPLAALDGNAIRVLSRLERLGRPDARGEPHASLAAALLDRRRPGEWNEALMELGETICTPATPRCGECPWRRSCRARRDGAVERHPPRTRRRPSERIPLVVTVVSDGRGRLLLERGAFPFLPHLWLPPTRVGPGVANGARVAFKHSILHREFSVCVRRRVLGAAELRRRARSAAGVERRVLEPGDLATIGRSALLTKALEAARAGERAKPAGARRRRADARPRAGRAPVRSRRRS